MKPFLTLLREKIIVFDGAMGTNIQAQHLTPDDYGGEKYAGCNEYLVVSRPSAIEKVHADFLEVGCDVVETNTFGASPIVLNEYGLAADAYNLNYNAALLARRVARSYASNDRPRYVAGSMGPTTKLPSLGQANFDQMVSGYYIQAKGLAEGGADLLVVETCQDILQAKTAVAGIMKYFTEARRRIPVIVSVTLQQSGTMLLGTEISAALTSLETFDIDVIGINCATGPKEMSESIRYLYANNSKSIMVMPNAGIPETVGSEAHYPLSASEFVRYMSHFVIDMGVNVAGGCCGTTKEHLRELVKAVGSLSPQDRPRNYLSSCSSTYQTVPLRIDRPPVLVGERLNANGSKQFRELLMRDDWEGIVELAKEQIRGGAHILDVCTAYVDRDEMRDMREIVTRLNTQSTAPLMLDSTDPLVIENSLKVLAGKSIINSINLEEGEEKMGKVLGLCRVYGAAVIAMMIDEQGMAKSVERKIEVARRIHSIAIQQYDLDEHNLIFDPLTFTLASGDEEFRRAGINTLEAIRTLKNEFPKVQTSLGISNISFGLTPDARKVLNSVFLHYAVEYGLDIAIVHASKILPLYKISKEEQEVCRMIIFDERRTDYDPLIDLIDRFRTSRGKTVIHAVAGESIDARLKKRIVDGNKGGLAADLDEALRQYPPLDIINNILLGGMKIVGDLFGSGQMQLPFVLQSAEVMKTAVSYLEKGMEKRETVRRGCIILATVKGDVHDIGKNLVDIILSNNGYAVINLGIQCPLEKMLTAATEHRADAIGMSGLLVKSTHVMKNNLEVMNERGIRIPVIVGGAALTRRYVDDVLANIYNGSVFYANDAFDGLSSMEKITAASPRQLSPSAERTSDPAGSEQTKRRGAQVVVKTESSVNRLTENEIPRPPFFGSAVVKSLNVNEVFPYINEAALIRGQWQMKRGKLKEDEYRLVLESEVYPEFKRMKEKAIAENLLCPEVVYGYFPCQSDGNDLIVYRPVGLANLFEEWRGIDVPERNKLLEWVRLTFPRQPGDRNLCIADYFVPTSSGIIDVVSFFIVTMGERASVHAEDLYKSHSYKEYLYFHGLSVETTEALAELWHKRVREEMMIHRDDAEEIKGLFSQRYRGARYSFGYPACPNLEDQRTLFEVLKPERIGIRLTETFQLVPEQSTSAIVVHHPQARYFSV